MNYVFSKGMEGLDSIFTSGIFSNSLYNYVIVLIFSTVNT